MARVFTRHGIEKIRLTGGEPLVRRNIEQLVEMLAAIPGLDLTLTTNGSLLTKKARALKAAGLQRITVSLDSLDDAVFKQMNDADFPVAKVLESIDAAAAAGLNPVKINMVVKRGLNDASILPMARHFRGSGHILRFIEYMDVGHTNGWRMDDVVTAKQIVAMIDAEGAARAGRSELPRRSRSALALPRRQRRDRRNRFGHPGVLPRLHARAALDRRQALHLPVRDRGPRPQIAVARRRIR